MEEGRATPISGICSRIIPTPGFPTPKGMATACSTALVDPTAEKHYTHTTVLSGFSSRPTPKEVPEGQYAPLQKCHTIAHLLSPLQKCVFYGRVGKSLRKTVLGPGFNFLQYRAGRPPETGGRPPNSPHSIHSRPTPNAISHTNVQSFSSRRLDSWGQLVPYREHFKNAVNPIESEKPIVL